MLAVSTYTLIWNLRRPHSVPADTPAFRGPLTPASVCKIPCISPYTGQRRQTGNRVGCGKPVSGRTLCNRCMPVYTEIPRTKLAGRVSVPCVARLSSHEPTALDGGDRWMSRRAAKSGREWSVVDRCLRTPFGAKASFTSNCNAQTSGDRVKMEARLAQRIGCEFIEMP